MQNDISRQWAFLTPFVPGEVLTAQAQQIESMGMAGIFIPEIYSSPWMGLGFLAGVTERVKLANGIQIAFTSSPFEIAMTAMDLDRVSNGRAVLGLGTSIRTWVEGFHGMSNYGKPVEHLREVIDIVRMIIRKTHAGEPLGSYDGKYHQHDWSTFLGAFAPAIRPEIPIWIAANQKGLTRLAGEVADGFIDHPIHGPHWTLTHGREALEEGLRKAGRSRSDIHWSCWLWVAVNNDRSEALNDSRATIAFYAGMKQYEPMFAKMGFEKEAQACSAALETGDIPAWVGAITDEMIETFVIMGTADECRKRVEEVWDVADSFCLVPPIGGLPPEKIMFYIGGIAETFYS
ncbi:MAG: LLM class flavin-dependent oxidoreductase [Actinomycetota bacterium]|nr:LLM class flavin-dependent oxidoreductase [Actinomycetota bacterium]